MNLLKEKTTADLLLEALGDDPKPARFTVLREVDGNGDFEAVLETDSLEEAARKIDELDFKESAYAFVLDNYTGEAIEKDEALRSLDNDIEDDEDLFECSLEESHMSDIDVTRQELERLLQDKREALDVMEMRHDPSEREDIEELKDDIRDISDILNDIEDGKLVDVRKRSVKHLGEDLDDSENISDEHKCCICGGPLGKYGNNAEPVKSGKCCDDCNIDVVIPARLNASKNNNIIHEDKEETITYSIVKIDSEYVPSVENYSTEDESDAVIDELKQMSDEELYNKDILGYAQLDLYNDNIDVVDYYISEKADFYKAQEALNSVSSANESLDDEGFDSDYEYDWYEDYDTHPLIDQYDAACDQLNVWAEGSTQGRSGRVDFLENDTDIPKYRVDFGDEIDFMNSLDPNEDNIESIKSFIADHPVSEDADLDESLNNLNENVSQNRIIYDEHLAYGEFGGLSISEEVKGIHVVDFKTAEDLFDFMINGVMYWDEEDLDQIEGDTIKEKVNFLLQMLSDPGDGSANIMYLCLNGEKLVDDPGYYSEMISHLDLATITEEELRKTIVNYYNEPEYEEDDLDESLLEKRRKKRKRKAQGWFVNYNAGNVEHNNDLFNHANGSDCEGCGEAAGMGEALDVEESDIYRGTSLIPSDNLGSWTKEEVLDELRSDLDTIYDQGYFDEGDIISIEEVITDDEGYFIIDSRSHGKANYELIGGRLYNYEAPERAEE